MKKKGPAASRRSDAQLMLTYWQEAVPNDRLAHLVKDVTRAFVRALQTRLSEHAISFGHWTFLRILWETDGLTQRELSDQAGVMEPTTFAAIKAMERLGYIQRSRRSDNKRNVYVHLTAKGRSLKAELVPLAQEVNRIGMRGIKAAEILTTRKTLLSILANLARDEIDSSRSRRRIPFAQPASRSRTVPARTPATRNIGRQRDMR
ncbi:MAG TPA: MarR family transcriptional regulator [Xanthobacteraceae bacterium]|nr:MarR family transcriptional regulator [Xanthobacteraceae bacterium]